MFNFDDWGSWGIGDFYPGNEKKLKDAIESGEDFDTGWHGFKKEVQSMRIEKDHRGIEVSVHAEMDDAFEQMDLFTDFLTSEELERITDEQVEEIRDYLYMTDFSCEVTDSETIDRDSDFDKIMETASKVRGECYKTLNDNFKECISTTLYVLYNNPDYEFIEKRIKEVCGE